MEQNQNKLSSSSARAAALRRALALTPREAVLLDAMLAGVALATVLQRRAAIVSGLSLRQHMHRLRGKLPRGGVESRRRPTRYSLSTAAVEAVRGLHRASGSGLHQAAPSGRCASTSPKAGCAGAPSVGRADTFPARGEDCGADL